MADILKDCTGVILAGGENKRMPVLKAFLEVDGEQIIKRNLRIITKLFEEVFIVTNQPEIYLFLGVPLLGDVYNVRGPMTGIFTSLLNSSNQWVFITACDMPFINKRLIKHLAEKRGNYDAVVPKSPLPPSGSGQFDFIEPLFSFYSKKLMLHMEKAITAGKTGLKEFLYNKRVKYIGTEEIQIIDVELRSFININTPEEAQYYLCPEGVSKKLNRKPREKTRMSFLARRAKSPL